MKISFSFNYVAATFSKILLINRMDYTGGIFNYVLGPGLIPQILLTIITLLAVSAIISLLETVVESVKRFDRLTSVLMNDTTTGQQLIVQSPDSGSPLIYPSENEEHGMEFSYSMYLFLSPETFEERSVQSCGTETRTKRTMLKHIFHKGSKDGWPLMSPGLYCEGDKNTLRLYMNSSTRVENYVEIPNVPVGKWFHLVITMKGKYLDVYVNGNVTVRHEFETVPKLNYGNIYVMYPIVFPKGSSSSNVGEKFTVDGAAKGMVSRLKYYAFALNYADIDSLYREGPSKKLISSSYSEIPPYFRDDWWVTKY